MANLYGIMTANASAAAAEEVFSLRINEWQNAESAAQDASDVTMGVFTGVLNNSTTAPFDVPQMTLEYTGSNKSRNKFGAQHMVVQLQNAQ